MKILHLCLANFYMDNYGYQENILTKMHKIQGHNVEIIASVEVYENNQYLVYTDPKEYENENGISVKRIPYIKWLPLFLAKKLRIYKGLYENLVVSEPDIIFLHGTQFMDTRVIAKYAKKNRSVKILADCHADYMNLGLVYKTKYSKNLLARLVPRIKYLISLVIFHKTLYKYCTKRIEKYTDKFYGTLPARADFLIDVYGIDKKKVELLVMGADDSCFDIKEKASIRAGLRKRLNIPKDDFVVVSGGKINHLKNIHLLMQAVASLNMPGIRLIVFGKSDNEMKPTIEELSKSENITYINWLSANEIYEVFLSSDLGFFPGSHSALWEQSVGTGLTGIFKRWEGMEHLNVAGNCLFIDEVSVEQIQEMIVDLFENRDKFEELKKNTMEIAMKYFSYSAIAERSIQ